MSAVKMPTALKINDGNRTTYSSEIWPFFMCLTNFNFLIKIPHETRSCTHRIEIRSTNVQCVHKQAVQSRTIFQDGWFYVRFHHLQFQLTNFRDEWQLFAVNCERIKHYTHLSLLKFRINLRNHRHFSTREKYQSLYKTKTRSMPHTHQMSIEYIVLRASISSVSKYLIFFICFYFYLLKHTQFCQMFYFKKPKNKTAANANQKYPHFTNERIFCLWAHHTQTHMLSEFL